MTGMTDSPFQENFNCLGVGLANSKTSFKYRDGSLTVVWLSAFHLLSSEKKFRFLIVKAV